MLQLPKVNWKNPSILDYQNLSNNTTPGTFFAPVFFNSLNPTHTQIAIKFVFKFFNPCSFCWRGCKLVNHRCQPENAQVQASVPKLLCRDRGDEDSIGKVLNHIGKAKLHWSVSMFEVILAWVDDYVFRKKAQVTFLKI